MNKNAYFRRWAAVLPGTGLCFFLMAPESRALDFYVATTGSDTNAGTFAAPFATLEKARLAIRTLKRGSGLPAGGANVWLRGGVYVRTSTFALTAADAGAPATPITWRGYTGEEVRVVGAAQLDPAWFTVVSNTSPVWSRLDTNACGHVMQAGLAAHGITNYGTFHVRGFGASAVAALELFLAGAPMPLARYPDPDQDEPAQTYTNTQLTVLGTPGPIDVTGLYVTNGLSDGVNQFKRVGLVSGRQYYLYRNTWECQEKWHTAWFLTTNTSGYPGNTDPWWNLYSPNLGLMNSTAQSGSTGTIHFNDSAKISHGWMAVGTVTSARAFTYTGSRPERWAHAEDPWFHGFWYNYWADQHDQGVNINTNKKSITLGAAPTFGILAGQAYYAENLLEEITEPGEWYLNRTNGMLYFWPPAPLAGTDLRVSMLEHPVWSLTDTTDITVRDLTIEMGRANLIAISGGTRNAFIHCTLRNAGQQAGSVSGTSNGVSSCTILHPGDGGICLSGAGSRATLVPACNFVRNCTMRDFSRWTWTYQPAVLIAPETVGGLVSHNSMQNAPHTAILFGHGNDNIIEYNDIGNVCQWSSDAGAIYIGRDWAARGNVIRYNFVHDVRSLFAGYGTQGIYLDDCQSGVQVFGNVLYRISDAGIQMGGGRDNLMENNVIVRCGAGLAADGRGTGWMFANNESRNLWLDLQRLPYQNALWSNAYPRCAAIPNNWSAITNGPWLRPQGNVFARNIGFSNATWISQNDDACASFAANTNNLANADPLFVDEANLNLALRTNSPAFTLPGFQAIPFSAIGLERNLTLAVHVRGGGSVSATPAQNDYYPMQFVWLAATPSNQNWRFDAWAGAVSGTSATVNAWMTNALDITAVFKPVTP